MIGLVVVLLVIFIVPNAIYNIVGGEDQEIEPFMKWTPPGGEEVVLDRQQFQSTRYKFSQVFQIGGFTGYQLGEQLGVVDYDSQGPNFDLSDEEVARLVILDTLSRDAGITITPRDLQHHIAPIFDAVTQNGQDWNRQLAQRGGAAFFESALQTVLRVQRYVLILGEVAALPDPTGVEEAWAEEHVENLYDYVEIELATLEEEVRAEAPEADALQEWFDGLEELERNRYREPERRSVGLALYRDPEATPAAGLLETYPEPEGKTEEELVHDYYIRVFSNRFQKPPEPEVPEAPEEPTEEPTDDTGPGEEPTEEPTEETADDAGTGEEPAAEEPPVEDEVEPDRPTIPTFYSEEEVLEQCKAEAPIFFALERWRRDVASRQVLEEEEVDLAAEAETLGLSWEIIEEPLDRSEFALLEEYEGSQLVECAFSPLEGYVSSRLASGKAYFGLVQVVDVVEPTVPPVADIRERVLELWVEEKCEERAHASLQAISDGFDEIPPDEEEPTGRSATTEEPEVRRTADTETFRAAAEAAGYEVLQRGWLDKASHADADPDRNLPAHQHIRTVVKYLELEVGEIAPVATDGPELRAFLVRRADSREVPIERMGPATYESYQTRTVAFAPSKLVDGWNLEYMREEFGLWLASDAWTEADEAAETEGTDGDTPPADDAPPADDTPPPTDDTPPADETESPDDE